MKYSLLIFSFNQEKYIKDAIHSAISQDFDDFEIIVSDDNSTDDTFNLIENFDFEGIDKSRIKLKRNPTNLGLAENINSTVKMAEGDILVVMAGDDISLPNRISEIDNLFESSGSDLKMIFSNALVIDGNGVENELYFKSNDIDHARKLSDMEKGSPCWALGATVAFRKEVFSFFGNLPSDVIQEDGAFAFRALLLGRVAYINKPLVKYRIHDSNMSQGLNFFGKIKFKGSERFLWKARFRDLAKVENRWSFRLNCILFKGLIKSYCFHALYRLKSMFG